MIVSNQIRCRKCGDTIYSAFRHDMKYCKCGAVSVDGGSGYLKRGGDLDDIEEQSIIIDDELAELFFEAAKQSEAANKNHIGAILAALRVLRDNGYGEALEKMKKNIK